MGVKYDTQDQKLNTAMTFMASKEQKRPNFGLFFTLSSYLCSSAYFIAQNVTQEIGYHAWERYFQIAIMPIAKKIEKYPFLAIFVLFAANRTFLRTFFNQFIHRGR